MTTKTKKAPVTAGGKIVLATHNWSNNSFLIEDVARLGWLRKDLLTLDPTYGRGVWWKRFRPDVLFDHDLKRDGHDFRDMPYPDNTFPQIAFDPPYVSSGGRKTSTVEEFYDRYGMMGAPKTPQLAQTLSNDGLTEMYRLCAPRGIVLVKAMSYVSSGKLFPGDFHTYEHARMLGFTMVDRFIHFGTPRMQPARSRKDGKPVKQKHARNNCSTLFVFRKG